MEVLNWKVVKCLCQRFFCVLPSSCFLSGWMKAHFYEYFAEILLGPLISVDAVATFLLPAIVFDQCVLFITPWLLLQFLKQYPKLLNLGQQLLSDPFKSGGGFSDQIGLRKTFL